MLCYVRAYQRSAEQRAGEQARLSSEPTSAAIQAAQTPRDGQQRRETEFELHAHHIAKLDRFLAQAQRAAYRAGREFAGLTIQVDGQGLIRVYAIGMTSLAL